MQVKICGVRTLEDALTAAEAGADFIGLVFVPGRRRRLETSHAAAIVSGVKNALPNAPKFVGLFADQPLSEVNQTIQRVRVGRLPSFAAQNPWNIAARPDAQVIKVLHVPDSASGENDAAEFASHLKNHADTGI